MIRARSGRLGSIVAVVIALVWWPGSAVVQPVVAAAVGWPPSSLVLSEVQTGGASASDEFVEDANEGPGQSTWPVSSWCTRPPRARR